MIVLYRVDDRLVHGQVAVGWKNALEANHLIVVDDEVFQNDFDRSLMEMSVPTGLKLTVTSVGEACGSIKKADSDSALRSIVLVKTPDIFQRLMALGCLIKEVNIGGMRFSPGKEQVTRAVFLNDADKALIREMAAKGVSFEGRIVPTDKKGDFLQLL